MSNQSLKTKNVRLKKEIEKIKYQLAMQATSAHTSSFVAPLDLSLLVQEYKQLGEPNKPIYQSFLLLF